MGKQDELAAMIYSLQQEGIDLEGPVAVDEGVVFTSLKAAKVFSERYGKDLTRMDGQVSRWLAKDRGPAHDADPG